MIFQAGDSEEGREFAAARPTPSSAGTRTLEAGQAFYADVKSRLARYGRARDQLLILPAATFVLGDTDAEAAEIAHEVRLQQVSGQTAIAFLEQLWNRDLSGYDPDGPLPSFDPEVSGEHDRSPRAGPASGNCQRPARTGDAMAGASPPRRTSPTRELVIEVTGRQSFIGSADTIADHDQPPRAGGRQRRLHPRPAHHPGRARRVRRQGRAAAAGARRLPHRVRGHAPCASTSASHRSGADATPVRAAA